MKFSDIDEYRKLRREGKISQAEFDYIKKFDDEYYGRKYFGDPLNKDFKTEDANRCAKHTKLLKQNHICYYEFMEYDKIPEELSGIEESLKLIGPKDHLHMVVERHRDTILEDPSPETIERLLNDMVVQSLLTFKYERRTQKLEKN